MSFNDSVFKKKKFNSIFLNCFIERMKYEKLVQFPLFLFDVIAIMIEKIIFSYGFVY